MSADARTGLWIAERRGESGGRFRAVTQKVAEDARTLNMDTATIGVHWTAWPVLVHSARTAVAVVTSLVVAQLFGLPEAYWDWRFRS